MTYHSSNAILTHQVLAFITPVVQSATSDADLKQRLVPLGYNYRDTTRGRMLTTEPQGLDVVLIPSLGHIG